MPKLGLGLSLSTPKIIGGGNVPPIPQNGLSTWLRADIGVSFNEENQVISWTDQSDNGAIFTADYVSPDITYATDYINGLPAILFSTASEDGAVALSSPTPYEIKSIFVVIKQTAKDYDYATIYESNGLSIYSIMGSTSNSWGSYLNINTNALTVLNTNQSYILSARSTDGTDQTFYLNNQNDTNASGDGFYNQRTQIVIGNGEAREFFAQPFQGAIMEIIAYQAYLTEQQMTQVYNYLNSKYAIQAP